MKKIITTKTRVSLTPHQRTLRRLFKQAFDRVINREDSIRQQELLSELLRSLHSIEDMLEVMAQLMHRSKKGR